MISVSYANAMAEVLEYLKGIREEDLKKISPQFIRYLEENASKEYSINNLDYTKPLNELKLSDKAKSIIALICYKYWCESEEESKLLLDILNNNEKKWERQINEKISFKSKNETPTEKNETTELPATIPEKTSFFQRIIMFFRRKFKRR